MESSKTAGSQVEETGSRFDTLLLISALALLIGGLAVYYVFLELPKSVRLLLLLGSIAAAVAAVYRTAIGHSLWSHVQGARVELRKVVWPTRQESLQTTLIIAIFVLIVALMMWGLDATLLWGVQKLTGRSA
ncbi:preprotein translocase subunit SecE [uncultured Nevskia sp.]|uniref:preprotein translocase subunit SecE n=1 Tax=uncultured Nevskia sp. TaxID=228950 RepID=UPI0025E4263D|nr:preprotein translocase subunit SecE [uncultured Nevskia sp.]